VTTSTLLHRQVHPKFIQHDGVSSQSFTPNSEDDNMLSVYDGEQFTALDSFENYSSKGLTTAGVLSVSVSEVREHGLPCSTDDETFIGHVLIDYNLCPSKKQIKKTAGKLKDAALLRDWQYKGSDFPTFDAGAEAEAEE
jgi:hypothetical protein